MKTKRLSRKVLITLVVAVAAVFSVMFMQQSMTAFAAQIYATNTQVTVNLEDGTYFGQQSITLGTDLVDGEIYYTLDGSIPSKKSNIYSGTFKIGETTNKYTLRAIAFSNGYYSNVTTRNYMIYNIGKNVAEGKPYTTNIDYIRYMTGIDTDTSSVVAAFDGRFTTIDAGGFQAYATAVPGKKECGNINNGQEYPTITVDLGATYTVNRFMWQAYTNFDAAAENKYMYGASVEVSTDNKAFTKVFFTEKGSYVEPNVKFASAEEGGAFFKMFSPTEARYVKFYGGVADPVDAKTVAYEFQIYEGTEEPFEDLNEGAAIPAYINPIEEVIVDTFTNEASLDTIKNYLKERFGTTYEVMDSNGKIYQLPLSFMYPENFDASKGGTFLFLGTLDKTSLPADLNDLYNIELIVRFTIPRRGDTSELDKLVAYVEAKTSSDYTSSTYAVVAAQLATAKSMQLAIKSNIDSYTQIQIDDFCNAFNTSIEELVLLGNKNKLNAYIEEVKNTTGETYTVASFNAFTAALTIAETVKDSDDVNQNQVDVAFDALTNAYKNLKTAADLTELNAYIAQVKDTLTSKYTPATADVFTNKLELANSLVSGTDITKEDADKALNELKQAFEALTEKADKEQLNEKILIAMDKVKETTKYTAKSIADLQVVLDAANETYANVNASKQEVDELTALLNNKIENLITLGDHAALNKLICEIESNKLKYTITSWSSFELVLRMAKSVDSNAQSSSEELKKSTDELTAEIENLVLLGDKTELNKLLAIKVDDTKYTALSLIAYDTVRQNSLLIANKEDASKAEVDAAFEKLKKATEALVELGNKTELGAKLSEAKKCLDGKYTAETLADLKIAVENANAVSKDSQASADDVKNAQTELENAISALKKTSGCNGSFIRTTVISGLLCLAFVIFMKSKK